MCKLGKTMAPHKKRQRLSEDGAVKVISDPEDEILDHTKVASSLENSKHAKRSLFVRSLPTNTTTEDLTEHFSQSFPIKHAVAVVDKDTKLCKGYGFVTFAESEDAEQAIEELNGTEIHGKKIKVELAESRHRGEAEDGVVKPPTARKGRPGQPPEDAQPPKLIIRNLPWSVDSEDKLSKLFLSYGKVTHSALPKNPQGRMLGFGIVIIRGKKNAEKALAGVNGKLVDGRTLAVDWAVDKDTWQKVTKAEVVEEAEQALAEQVPEGSNGVPVEIDEDIAADEGHFSDVGDEYSIKSEEEEEKEMPEEEPPPKRTTNNDSTLFVRNLPFHCKDEDLQEHFEQFGPIRYARIVIDRETELPKGTGFVCFYNVADADECLKGAPRPKAAVPIKTKKDTGASHSVLQNEFIDPSGDYTLDGRVLQITHAVDKNEATRLTNEGTAQRSTRDRDKRRLYLLSEGTIPSNAPLYQTLSPSEIAMREASSKQRKALIESNPSLSLSLTRLSVRNIPRTLTTKDLKALAREAVVGFATDVKAGTRQRLSNEELARGGDEMKQAEKERKASGKGIVRQAKIVYEGQEGGKVAEGAGRSRGYGFIEYHTHRSALMGLRWLNGHSIDYKAMEHKGKKTATKEDVQEKKKRLIVEFAIENAQVVARRNEREVKSRDRTKTGEKDDESTKAGSTAAGAEAGRKRKRNDGAAASKSTAEDEELAKRQKIIGRKRMKKARKGGAK
ncbi:RNA-binding domain-containing protein [Tothia fuscella]|uniref:RNA-binding domain-containing protein n=1 Tax=Tothia fuscella TaxID=1048955 RepID=A0A9P4NMW7_9PEZI|nr:RNA-binding domain-containing protein [Tothia fuscella]